ncbi:hypothetical protein, partial [Nocardia wallacei]|uniref:hypothetical protein n=1 Tax=Nocardia wallacei TaxID=480035 RepID=UPI002455EC7E
PRIGNDRNTYRRPGDATVRNRVGTRLDDIERRRQDEGVIRARGRAAPPALPTRRAPAARTGRCSVFR